MNTPLPPTIWTVKPIEEQRALTLTDWAIFGIKMSRSPVRRRHFAGYNVQDREGRASSAIVQFDTVTLRGVTKSGRVYQLSGSPGLEGDGQHVWASWLRLAKATDVERVQLS
ncbi:hypothetical protein [Rhodoferax sp.]|uniref:hypothetical protein n=1 Tax=Rhodoferax sp. TaxID=50421 RepID=UPI00284621AC|nr:hypothetical protein [Rhodoferax sp.]MDR3369071.1 hypothetical protein [Rhodoferax sp.]